MDKKQEWYNEFNKETRNATNPASYEAEGFLWFLVGCGELIGIACIIVVISSLIF